MGKLYIITGASGYVGSSIIKKLCESKNNFNIIAIVHNKKLNIEDKRIKIVNANIKDITSLEPIFNVSDYEEKVCIHCAGVITILSNNSKNVYDVNVKGTKNIVKMCERHNFNKLIYISTADILYNSVGNIITEQIYFDSSKYVGDYAKSKAMATQYVIDSCKKGLNAIIVYPTSIFGPGIFKSSNLNSLIDMYLNKKIPAVFNGGYDFIDIRDVVNGIILIEKKGNIGEGYILSNQYFTIKQVLDKLSDLTGYKKIKIVVCDCLIDLISPLAEKISLCKNNEPKLTPYSVLVLRTKYRFNHNKSTKELGFKTRPFNTSLLDTIKYLNKKGNKVIKK